jgi:hypothetical protein
VQSRFGDHWQNPIIYRLPNLRFFNHSGINAHNTSSLANKEKVNKRRWFIESLSANAIEF